MSNLKYIKEPYHLTEEELAKKPLTEVIELVDYIKDVVKQVDHDLKVHYLNAEVIRKFLCKDKEITN
jgi:hypothetical protein